MNFFWIPVGTHAKTWVRGATPTNTNQQEFTMITRFFQDESGATAIEYGLIAALVAVVIIAALIALGNALSSTFASVNAQLSSAS